LSGDLCSNFAYCIAPLKTLIYHYTKNKKFCDAKNILPKSATFFAFSKKMALQNFYILLISLSHDDEYPPFLGGIQFSLTNADN
jgi:hypothetical protein